MCRKISEVLLGYSSETWSSWSVVVVSHEVMKKMGQLVDSDYAESATLSDKISRAMNRNSHNVTVTDSSVIKVLGEGGKTHERLA